MKDYKRENDDPKSRREEVKFLPFYVPLVCPHCLEQIIIQIGNVEKMPEFPSH